MTEPLGLLDSVRLIERCQHRMNVGYPVVVAVLGPWLQPQREVVTLSHAPLVLDIARLVQKKNQRAVLVKTWNHPLLVIDSVGGEQLFCPIEFKSSAPLDVLAAFGRLSLTEEENRSLLDVLF